MAFQQGDPITPQVLQKLQPLIALLVAAVLLGERVTRRFPLFAVPALLGAWLVAFADPLSVGVADARAAGLAAGAAALWAAGTVLGRYASAELSAMHVTTLRFTIGLVTALVLAVLNDAPLLPTAADIPGLLLLALIPGLLALRLYYVGLRATAASRATFAELAFPVTAVLVGVTVLDARIDASQWFGIAVVVASVTLLAWHERRSRVPAVRAPVQLPQPVGQGS